MIVVNVIVTQCVCVHLKKKYEKRTIRQEQASSRGRSGTKMFRRRSRKKSRRKILNNICTLNFISRAMNVDFIFLAVKDNGIMCVHGWMDKGWTYWFWWFHKWNFFTELLLRF